MAERLAPYRAGYTAEERRRIEGDLVSGRLLGVVATEALELGVDVGLLDCALADRLSRARSRACASSGAAPAGAARDSRCSCPAPTHSTVTSSTTPTRCWDAPNEAAILDPTNPEIRIGHLRAAAHELPLTESDDDVLGARRAERGRGARRGRRARAHARRAWPGAAPARPPGSVSLRSGSADAIAVVERATGALLGMLEQERAFSTVHEGAVYLHRGETYLAETLDLDDRVALVAPFDGPWYTQPRRETETSIVRALSGPCSAAASSSATARSR